MRVFRKNQENSGMMPAFGRST